MANLVHISRYTLLLILVVGYPLVAHFVSVSDNAGRLAVLFAIGPVLGFLAFRAWASRFRYAVMAGSTLICVLLLENWNAANNSISWIYFAQHAGINAVLCLVFGRSLLRDREPICTRMATMVEAQLAPSVARYTRNATLAWALFFGSATLVSAGLFFFSSIMTWSMYANILYLPTIFLMFGSEYGVRLCVLRGTPHTDLIKTTLCVWKGFAVTTQRTRKADIDLQPTPQTMANKLPRTPNQL